MSHPILASTAVAGAALKDVWESDPLFMSPAEKARALQELGALASRVAELRLRVLARADDLAADTGARDAAGWLAANAPVDARTAHADLRLATDLERWCRVRAGLAEGCVSIEQARVIVRVLDDLPAADLDPDVLAAAEAELVRLAEAHRPEELRCLGAHLLTVVASDVADELEAKRLAAAEKRAIEDTRLHLKPLGDGRLRFSGILSDAVGARLRTVLESYAQPRKAALDADGKMQPRSRLFGLALGDLLESLDPKRLPAHGGDATTVMVTISLDQLKSELGSGLIEGEGLTAGEIRRLACTAKIIPAVLDGKSKVLDLGRAKRLFSPAQRKALRLEHRQCQAEGCTADARWCDAHHLDAWSAGGTTDLANAILLCGHHHRRAHDPAYDARRLPNGDFRFSRRT